MTSWAYNSKQFNASPINGEAVRVAVLDAQQADQALIAVATVAIVAAATITQQSQTVAAVASVTVLSALSLTQHSNTMAAVAEVRIVGLADIVQQGDILLAHVKAGIQRRVAASRVDQRELSSALSARAAQSTITERQP